jgi:hypothetical protein
VLLLAFARILHFWHFCLILWVQILKETATVAGLIAIALFLLNVVVGGDVIGNFCLGIVSAAIALAARRLFRMNVSSLASSLGLGILLVPFFAYLLWFAAFGAKTIAKWPHSILPTTSFGISSCRFRQPRRVGLAHYLSTKFGPCPSQICNSCAEIRRGFFSTKVYCMKCRNELSLSPRQLTSCRFCGMAVPPRAAFCPNCGKARV